MRVLQEFVSRAGDRRFLRVSRISAEIATTHLKVVVADGQSAYAGSANITGAGLRGRNAELGVLLYGLNVALIDSLLDLYRSS